MALSSTSVIVRQYEAARRTNLDNYKVTAVLENADFIVGMNKQQMRMGQTANGDAIKPRYSRSYNIMKLQMNTFKAPSMTPDLFLTGQLQKGMGIKVASKTYSFFSSDVKADKVFGRYKNVLGLQKQNKDKAKIKVTNLFTKRIYAAIHKA